MQPQSSAYSYKVSEVFYSLQGEGLHVGTAAIFIRLAGCSMACPWCDTLYANKTTTVLTAADILKDIQKYPAKTVVITGGEPTEQNLAALLDLLAANNYKIHLETNGSIDIDTSKIYCVTVSPKKNVSLAMLEKAHVIKLVLDDKLTLEQIKSYQKYLQGKAALYLQPEGNKKENIEKCLQIIKENPSIKLSLQLHKMLKIR